MNIADRFISRTVIASIIIGLLSFFGYANGTVSYKYEVQDSIFSGQRLDDHQKSILADIAYSKYIAITCLILFVCMIYVSQVEPTFKGRITYKNKGRT